MSTRHVEGEDRPTPQEELNLAAVKEYISIAYDPARASAAAVRHLVADGSRFVAPSTFPEASGAGARRA